ncbi:hypothetical protein HAX54_013634, partial [Datura stramonium]|nr:hypothetical protein [Datura stramonium]
GGQGVYGAPPIALKYMRDAPCITPSERCDAASIRHGRGAMLCLGHPLLVPIFCLLIDALT